MRLRRRKCCCPISNVRGVEEHSQPATVACPDTNERSWRRMNSGAVLVVEDESLILLDIEHSLREAGFEVIAVYKGDNAIATFDRNPVVSQPS